jgi:hypothetical protein
MQKLAKSAKDLSVYQAAYALEDHDRLTTQALEVGAMLGSMIKDPSSFLIKSP